MKENKCRNCSHMDAQAPRHGGLRCPCYCGHPKAKKAFHELCPKSNRDPCFIAFSIAFEYVPEIKTCPRWCPLKNGY